MSLKNIFISATIIISSLLIWLVGCSPTTQPSAASNVLTLQSSVAASIVEDELTIATLGGVPIDSSNGEFSIGWNQFIGPVDQNATKRGDATVVVFNGVITVPRPPLSLAGQDIGSVYLNYGSNHQQFNKIQHPFGGTFYSIFSRLFDDADAGVSFIGNSAYEFEVTGSSTFSAVKIAVMSPAERISITSQTNGEHVSRLNDLALTWTGGNSDNVLVRLTPMVNFGPDGFAPCDSGSEMWRPAPRRMGPGGRGPSNDVLPPPGMHVEGSRMQMRIDTGFVSLLNGNPGQFVISASVLQQVLGNAAAVSVSVSQLSGSAFMHDGGTYRLVMRDGDRKVLIVD